MWGFYRCSDLGWLLCTLILSRTELPALVQENCAATVLVAASTQPAMRFVLGGGCNEFLDERQKEYYSKSCK